MLKRPAVIAFAIVITTSCGVDYSKHSYERVGAAAKPVDGVPWLHVAEDAKNKMKVGPPYTAIVSMTAEVPFTIKSVVYEHDGVEVTALDPSSSAIQSKPRGKTTEKMKARFAKIPLGALEWVAGSRLELRAEVLPQGATEAIVVEQTLEATKTERHYSCSEYLSMF